MTSPIDELSHGVPIGHKTLSLSLRDI